MQRLKYSIVIDAPRAKVWDTMLGKSTYNEWTKVFHPTSRYEGSWNEGSEILFLATMDGKDGGMVSRIKESRPYESVTIEHLGVISDGKRVMSGPEVESWAGGLEIYRFHDEGQGTRVEVELDMNDEHVEEFNRMWPEALATLKQIAERPA